MKRKGSFLFLLICLCMLLSTSVFASNWETSKKAVIGDTFTVQIKGASGVFQWQNSNPNVAVLYKTTYSNACKVVALSKGTTNITVINNGKVYKCTVKVYKPNYGLKSDTYLQKGKKLKFKLKGGYGTKKVKSSNKKVVKVTKKGSKYTLKGKKVGKATISITYCGRTQKFKVYVTKGKQKTLKIAIASGESYAENSASNLVTKYSDVLPEVVDSSVDPSKYIGLIIPTGSGDIDPTWYGEINNGYSKNINRNLDRIQLNVLAKFISTRKPVLGLGRGMLLINVACGGSLYQNIKGHLGKLQQNYTIDGYMLNKLVGDITYNYCSHDQAIKKVGTGILITMYTADGVIEGIESKNKKLYGVSWDNEVLAPSLGSVVQEFISICK